MAVIVAIWVSSPLWITAGLVAARRAYRWFDPQPTPSAWVNHGRLDERTVDLLAAQFRGPQADEQIYRELSA